MGRSILRGERHPKFLRLTPQRAQPCREFDLHLPDQDSHSHRAREDGYTGQGSAGERPPFLKGAVGKVSEKYKCETKWEWMWRLM